MPLATTGMEKRPVGGTNQNSKHIVRLQMRTKHGDIVAELIHN